MSITVYILLNNTKFYQSINFQELFGGAAAGHLGGMSFATGKKSK
jgi:hypothetical protein